MKFFETLGVVKTAHAHCDIPCGIYDPHQAQLAAHTIIRMTDLIAEHKNEIHETVRYTSVKEEHAEMLKHEIRVIWGDYFKPEHAQKFPELHTLVWDIMKLGSKARQGVDKAVAEQLLEKVNRFAEIFWETKGVKTKKVKAPYPTGKDIVVPVLA
jgi:nickel superoxide dismutase